MGMHCGAKVFVFVFVFVINNTTQNIWNLYNSSNGA